MTLSVQLVAISRCGGFLSRVDRLGRGEGFISFGNDFGDCGGGHGSSTVSCSTILGVSLNDGRSRMLTVGDAGVILGCSVTFGGCGDLVIRFGVAGSAVTGKGIFSPFLNKSFDG